MQTKPVYRIFEPTKNLSAVRSMDELKKLIDTLYNSNALIGFDIETGYSGSDYVKRSLNPHHPLQFVVGFSITNSPTWARYIPLRHDFADNLDPNEVWPLMKPLLEEKDGVAHNLSFEAENMKLLDMKGDGPEIHIKVGNWFDSMIEAYVLSDVPPMPVSGSLAGGEFVQRYIPPFHQTSDGFQRDDINSWGIDLKDLTKFRYNYDQMHIHELFGDKKKMTKKEQDSIRFNVLPVDQRTTNYACDDAYLCLQLHNDQIEAIMEDPYLPMILKMEMKIAEVLTEMKPYGVSVDWDAIAENKTTFDSFSEEYRIATRKKFEEEVGRPLITLNLGSTQQLSRLLFTPKEEGGLGLEVTKRTDKGAPSTKDDALVSIRKLSPAVDSLLKYRQCLKMGEWFNNWNDLRDQTYDGKIHPSFKQTTVASGRFASAGPNVQNITKRWWFQNIPGSIPEVMRNGIAGKDYWTGNAREFILPSPGYRMLNFDYKSAEIQFIAALAHEDIIIDAFRNDDDFHKWAASLMEGKPMSEVTKEERSAAKAFAFGSIYGQSTAALAQQLGITKEQAEEIRQKYFGRFKMMEKYFEKQHALVEKENEVRTWLGRKATIWESMHDSRAVRNKAPRLSVNIPVQGSATGDYVKLAMIRVYNKLKEIGWWGEEIRLLMNQHDSLVFEVRNDIDIDEAIALLTPLVQFDVTGMQGTYDVFDNFPPMSVDWEVGNSWGGSIDLSHREVLDADFLEVEILPEATVADIESTIEVIVTNPGKVPVKIFRGATQIPYDRKVKASPDIIKKIQGGDPDLGITHKSENRIHANFCKA